MVVRSIAVFFVLLGLSACAPTLRHPTAFGRDCEAFDADVTCVRVFYGSNRAIVATAEGDAEVDVDQVARGDAGELRLGRADVWLPRLKADGTPRERGETPLLTGEPPEDPDLLERYVMITRITAQGQERFVEELGDAVSDTQGEPSILLFVHGFNVGFEPALISSAQLTVDLREDRRFDPGAPVLFAWPSQASVTPWAYFGDQKLADAAVPHLNAFLDLLLDEVRPARINIIAHSMGNRVLTQALEDYAEARLLEGNRPEVEFRIILAAADVERDVFGIVAGKLDNLEPNVTVYASDDDAALWVSRVLNRRPRLGQTDGDRPWIRDVPGYTTIDATPVASTLFGLGHGYYSDNPFILNDIRCALADLPIDDRALDPARYDGRPDGQTYFLTRTGGEALDDNCALRRRYKPDAPETVRADGEDEEEARRRALERARQEEEQRMEPAGPRPPVVVPYGPRDYEVYFGSGSIALDAAAMERIEQAVRYRDNSDLQRVIVTGHADAVDSREVNDRIALARARAVANRLIELGVPDWMIEIRSYGEERPQVAGPDDGPQRENRRVDIRIEAAPFDARSYLLDFGTGETTLAPVAERQIEEAHVYWEMSGRGILYVASSTAELATREASGRIAQERGEVVRDRLVALGVPFDKIEILAYPQLAYGSLLLYEQDREPDLTGPEVEIRVADDLDR